MKYSAVALSLIVAGFFGTHSLNAQTHTRDGATVGGVTGAVIGGIIGHQNDETPEGVLIGGAVGAIAGGLIGNAHDQQIARERAYRDHWARQQMLQSNRVARATSVADVIQMSQSGLADSVIINHVQANGIDRKLEVRDIISLHQQGVSETVISGMQRAPVATYRLESVPVPAPPPTVIVEEHCPHRHDHWRIYQAYPVGPPRYYWR